MQKRYQHHSKSLFAYCTSSKSMVGNLLKHAYFIQQLQSELHKYLGPPINTHCMIANYKKDILILHADSPAWAAKLRYMTPDILRYMRHQCQLTKLKTIRVKVLPITLIPVKTSGKRIKLSATSAKLINNVADTISDHALRTSLLKLARHNHSG